MTARIKLPSCSPGWRAGPKGWSKSPVCLSVCLPGAGDAGVHVAFVAAAVQPSCVGQGRQE